MMATGRARAIPALVALVVAAFVAAGCQAVPVGSVGAPSPVIASQPIPTEAPASPSSAAAATPTPRPTPTYPPRQSRPTDLPTDGTCEQGHSCLGLLGTGKHHTAVFAPGFSFTMPETGWENIGESPGAIGLFPNAAPGDAIFFFQAPQATKADGSPITSVPIQLDAIKTWIASNDALTATAPTDVTIGGLHGFQVDLGIPAGAGNHSGDCPVETCVMFFRGRDPSSKPSWDWDFGLATGERERLYVLQAKDKVVAVIADSLDGTTWDDLTAITDKVLKSVAFDKS